MGLIFPDINPVAIQIGPLAIRWYALAYVTGLVVGWHYVRRVVQARGLELSVEMVDDLLLWVMLGVILGGRIGYVLFYQFGYYAREPLEILAVWRGGMSFHGGLIGVIVAIVFYARRRGVQALTVADLIAPAFPFGLMLGRLSNFINGELYGRPTEVPWAMIFPRGGEVLRHPSQLYAAVLEGGLLLLLMLWLAHKTNAHRRVGLLSGVFLMGYSFARLAGELFREPDTHIGFLWSGLTMGQILCIPMAVVGLWLIVRPVVQK